MSDWEQGRNFPTVSSVQCLTAIFSWRSLLLHGHVLYRRLSPTFKANIRVQILTVSIRFSLNSEKGTFGWKVLIAYALTQSELRFLYSSEKWKWLLQLTMLHISLTSVLSAVKIMSEKICSNSCVDLYLSSLTTTDYFLFLCTSFVAIWLTSCDRHWNHGNKIWEIKSKRVNWSAQRTNRLS